MIDQRQEIDDVIKKTEILRMVTSYEEIVNPFLLDESLFPIDESDYYLMYGDTLKRWTRELIVEYAKATGVLGLKQLEESVLDFYSWATGHVVNNNVPPRLLVADDFQELDRFLKDIRLVMRELLFNMPTVRKSLENK